MEKETVHLTISGKQYTVALFLAASFAGGFGYVGSNTNAIGSTNDYYQDFSELKSDVRAIKNELDHCKDRMLLHEVNTRHEPARQ